MRAAEIDLLFTANTEQIDKADKKVKDVGQRVEKNPIKVDADAKPALAGMDRVEQAAKKLVSADTVVKLDAEIGRAEANIGRTKAKIEDLQVKAAAGLDVTADTKRAEAALQKAERSLKGLVEARSKIDIDADATAALAALAKVSAEKRVVSADVVAKVDADITSAERNVTRIRAELEVLASQEATPQVLVDVSKASARLDAAEKKLNSLNGARANMEVDADTSGADSALAQVQETAGDAGEDAGGQFGDSIIAALATIPIAGAVVGIAAAAAHALVTTFEEGLQIEVGYDRLQALTGIDEASAQRLGNAAGEAYANNFGDSIESNMDATRLALQFRILDPTATTRDAQLVVQSLAGIADVLGEDIQPVASTVSTLLSSGIAKSAQEAFDLIAVGARNGVNRADDLLDTLTEYPALFQRLGLSGPEALGLINQGLRAGARNSDLAADALKEFQIRATDASATSAEGFKALGLDAEEMTAKIAAGGQSARDGLALVLEKLRETEDPVARNAAAVALFGTQAEDLGAALFAMDLSTAVDELGTVTGAAQKMFDTMSGNDASKIETAKRNIEVAVQGIQGALAAAFTDPLGEFADWVSRNRGPLMQFLLDVANGALDFGDSVVEAVASGTESLGDFVGSLSEVVYGLAAIPAAFGDMETSDALVDMANGMLDFSETTDETADGIRENLGGAIDVARTKLNDFGEPVVALGFVNDAALRTAEAISGVGVAADGSRLMLDGLDIANLRMTESGRALDDQLKSSASSLESEYTAALLAGESQDNLAGRYNATSEALMGQLTAMGLTREQAQYLIDTVLKTPEEAVTVFSSNAQAESTVVDRLTQKVIALPDGQFAVVANTSAAQAEVDNFIRLNSQKRVTIAVGPGGSGGITRASGGPIFGPGGPRDDLVPVMASNGEHMWTAAEVLALGGHDEMYRLRRAVRNGSLKLAGGGPVIAPDTWSVASPRYEPVQAPTPDASSRFSPYVRPVTVNQKIYTQASDGRVISRQLGRGVEQALGAV